MNTPATAQGFVLHIAIERLYASQGFVLHIACARSQLATATTKAPATRKVCIRVLFVCSIIITHHLWASYPTDPMGTRSA